MQSSDTLVPCDTYHPALFISCPFPSVTQLDIKHSFRDFKKADYVSILDDLGTINCDNILSPSIAEKSAKFQQQTFFVIIVIIHRRVPLRMFNKLAFSPWA